jgi:hypothetical protein
MKRSRYSAEQITDAFGHPETVSAAADVVSQFQRTATAQRVGTSVTEKVFAGINNWRSEDRFFPALNRTETGPSSVRRIRRFV